MFKWEQPTIYCRAVLLIHTYKKTSGVRKPLLYIKETASLSSEGTRFWTLVAFGYHGSSHHSIQLQENPEVSKTRVLSLPRSRSLRPTCNSPLSFTHDYTDRGALVDVVITPATLLERLLLLPHRTMVGARQGYWSWIFKPSFIWDTSSAELSSCLGGGRKFQLLSEGGYYQVLFLKCDDGKWDEN